MTPGYACATGAQDFEFAEDLEFEDVAGVVDAVAAVAAAGRTVEAGQPVVVVLAETDTKAVEVVGAVLAVEVAPKREALCEAGAALAVAAVADRIVPVVFADAVEQTIGVPGVVAVAVGLDAKAQDHPR